MCSGDHEINTVQLFFTDLLISLLFLFFLVISVSFSGIVHVILFQVSRLEYEKQQLNRLTERLRESADKLSEVEHQKNEIERENRDLQKVCVCTFKVCVYIYKCFLSLY